MPENQSYVVGHFLTLIDSDVLTCLYAVLCFCDQPYEDGQASTVQILTETLAGRCK